MVSSARSEGTVSDSGLSFQNIAQYRSRLQVGGDANSKFVLETFVNSLQLHLFRLMSEEAKHDHLEKFDALDLFNALQEINSELAIVKLENHFLIDFLEKNDPKLLAGLKTRRATATLTQRRPTATAALSGNSSQQTVRTSIGSRRSIGAQSLYTATQSVYTSGSKPGAPPMPSQIEYRLNYKAKADMAEKASTEVEKRIHDIEAKAMHTIKLLNARIEEARYQYTETDETIKNFTLHFLKDERDIIFLETATEKQLERKFRKFVNNWLKNAGALLSTMRLRITALQETYQSLRSDLITKSDLSGILGAVDFEQLMIKRNELLNALDEKNTHMTGLKGVTGKASLAMSEEKQIMTAIEDESKSIINKTAEIIRNISKLEREANQVEDENRKEHKQLMELKDQLNRYEAPSVNDYIEKKDELLMLEKEEKMLQRKIYILNMKLSNIFKKCSKKKKAPEPNE